MVLGLSYRQQVGLAGVAVVASALAVAALLNGGSAWWSARNELMQTARQIDQRSMQVRAESMRLANSLPDDEDCDRAALRRLMAKSHYLRDIGKIHGTRIYCDAQDGSGARIDLGPPQVTRADGVRVWVNERGVWAARGHNALVIDPASFLDAPLPADTTIAIIEIESGRAMASSAPLAPALVAAAWKVGPGSFTSGDKLLAISKSRDGRTLELAVRPISAIRAAAASTRSRYLLVGGFAGLVLALVLALALRHRRSMMFELRHALKHHLLGVALQPIVGFEGGLARVVGFECLARWQTSDGDDISPSRFVPMIEAAGLGPELARCMIANLAREFGATLIAQPDIYVALNLSSADVASSALLDDIDKTLVDAGIPTSQIVIELTERTFEAEGLTEGLDRLRKSGHRLSIDDFGTGASNASRLASFHPEMVKVDRSFLVHADGEGVAAALLPQLVAMAHSCGAKVVIEGVETLEQASSLAAFGEVFAQGYYWHRPMDAGDAAMLIAGQMVAKRVNELVGGSYAENRR